MFPHLDLPDRSQVDRLLTSRRPASVSLYLTTDPVQGADAERLELRNLLDEAVRQLREAGHDKRETAEIQDLVRELVDDALFWEYQARSLAVFATPDDITTYRLPHQLSSLVEVSDRFHVKPLLRALTFPSSGYVLALSENAVRVLEVLPEGEPGLLSIQGMPRDAADAAGRPSISDRSPRGRVQGGEGRKMRLGQYSRAVDQALHPLLVGRDIPLILAATQPLDGIYRQWNTYPHLAVESLEGNPDSAADHDLAARARKVIDLVNASALAEVKDLFDERASAGRAATDVADVARAATYAMVDTVLVDIDAVMPGTIDETSGVVIFAEKNAAGSYGIVDEIARRMWLTGGRVLAVRREDIPGGRAVAAILRWAS